MLGLTSQEMQENFSEFISTFDDICEFIKENNKSSYPIHRELRELQGRINKLECVFHETLGVYRDKEKQELEEDEEYFG
jgi:hypothetical protein